MDRFKSKIKGIVNLLEPIEKNPYNSLYFYLMMVLNALNLDKKLCVKIFKSFDSMAPSARNFICKLIFQDYIKFHFD